MMASERLQEAAYLRESQYQDSTFLTARARLHSRFSTAVTGWHTWVFNHLSLAGNEQVLECGCGAGWLWRSNLMRLPTACRITLTDLSLGMVTEARAALAHVPHFAFQTADIQHLPFTDESFDVVIANHVLYHVPDIPRALQEVRRVLKQNGRFYAVTNGAAHMRELREMYMEAMRYAGVDAGESELLAIPLSPFRLENGAALLAPFFAGVQLLPYEDSLRVTEVQPLIDYAFSFPEARTLLTPARLSRIRQFVADQMTAIGGVLHITKAVGMFVGVKEV